MTQGQIFKRSLTGFNSESPNLLTYLLHMDVFQVDGALTVATSLSQIMKECSTTPRSLEIEPHNQMQCSFIPRTPLFWWGEVSTLLQ